MKAWSFTGRRVVKWAELPLQLIGTVVEKGGSRKCIESSPYSLRAADTVA